MSKHVKNPILEAIWWLILSSTAIALAATFIGCSSEPTDETPLLSTTTTTTTTTKATEVSPAKPESHVPRPDAEVEFRKKTPKALLDVLDKHFVLGMSPDKAIQLLRDAGYPATYQLVDYVPTTPDGHNTLWMVRWTIYVDDLVLHAEGCIPPGQLLSQHSELQPLQLTRVTDTTTPYFYPLHMRTREKIREMQKTREKEKPADAGTGKTPI